MPTRRTFLSAMAAAAAGVRVAPLEAVGAVAPLRLGVRSSLPDAAIGWRGESACAMGLRAGTLQPERPEPRLPHLRLPPAFDLDAVGGTLRNRFPDLRRRIVFEYYPWYAADPWRHWDQWERRPPFDIAATAIPRLGPYDSRALRVIEQHARWIAESGVGAINISWWGRDSFEDRLVPRVMDVMRDHDIHVTFHLEPYRVDRASSYYEDVLYLLREYGEKRRWDSFLLLDDGDGGGGPVFKSFRTILPPQAVDCHGRVFAVEDHVPPAGWRRQTDRLRGDLRHDFDRLTLLADASDVGGMVQGGFDGMAIYDNFVRPASWRSLAEMVSVRDLVFSFNTNPGYDGIHLRTVEPDSCYVPSPIEPPGSYDWGSSPDREAAARQSRARIQESFVASTSMQADPGLANARRRFFLLYVNSFNEWHEGHQFEPMKDAAGLTLEERRYHYRNPTRGDYRLTALGLLVAQLLDGRRQPQWDRMG